MTVDLRFAAALGSTPGGAVALRFGAIGTPVDPPLPDPSPGLLRMSYFAQWQAAQASTSPQVLSAWGDSHGTQCAAALAWVAATSDGRQVDATWAATVAAAPVANALSWGVLSPSLAATRAPWASSFALTSYTTLPSAQADRIAHLLASKWRHGARRSAIAKSNWRRPARVSATASTNANDAVRASRQSLASWQGGSPLVAFGSPFVPFNVTPPAPTPCYVPDVGSDVVLLFAAAAKTNADLRFACVIAAVAVVPIRRVYVVVNNVTLRRVVGDVVLPALSVSMSIDADSWTWAFSATLPASTLADVQRVAGDPPVELEANINGNLYRVLAENIGSDRTFGQRAIRVSGRGKSAFLSAPYAPVLTFANSVERTAQQLMNDVLMFNEIPIGWDVDWQIDDWLVPGGVFAMQGTYIDGLNAIAGAAGAYLQPHPVNQEISVLPRYPVKPWAWGGVSPDFELPSAVTVQEGIEWLDRADYDGVYVSGQSSGILGMVFKGGTAGAALAPMVTDSLITGVNAARQRGLSILGNTGRKAMLTLRLPVLPETGVITPGKFVRYTDPTDGNKLGLVRSVSVEVRSPDVFQTLLVETQV